MEEAWAGPHQLWCGGLDPATTAAELQELFGRVAPCTVALRRSQRQEQGSGGPRLFAYISYAAAEHAAAAQQQLDRQRLHGRSLRVMPRLWQPEGAPRGARARPGVRLELQDLAPAVGSQQLQALGAAFGRVLSASVAVDDSGLSTGAGACVFETAEAAQAALASWQGACVLGPAVVARLAPQPQPAPAMQQLSQQQQQGPSRSSRRNRPKPAVVVRGLAPTTTAEQLQSAFSAAGEIRRLRLVADEDGRSAGVAFITFTDMPAVRAAVALADSLVVDGRQPSVQPAHREVAGDCEGGHCGEEEEAAAPHAPAPGSDPAPAPGARDSPLQRSRSSGLSASASHLPAAEAAGAMHRASSSPALSGLAAPPAPYSPPVFSAVSGAGAGAITGPGEQSTDTLFVRPLGADTDEAALRQLFAAHPGLTFVRVLRHADGASKGCGFVRFSERAQAQAALQALDGTTHGGRQLRVTWAQHRATSQRASWDQGAAGAGAAPPLSFGPSSSADPGLLNSPAAAQPFFDAAGAVPAMPASPGYPASGVVLQTYWLPLQTYALPPGSPLSPMAAPAYSMPPPPPLAMFGAAAGMPAQAQASTLASPRRGGQAWGGAAAAGAQQAPQQWQQAHWQQAQWHQQQQPRQQCNHPQWQAQQQVPPPPQLVQTAVAAAGSWQARPRSAPPSPLRPPLLRAQAAQPPSPSFFWGGSGGPPQATAPAAVQTSQRAAPAAGPAAAAGSQPASPAVGSGSGSSLSLAPRHDSRSGSSGATPSAEAGASQPAFPDGEGAGGVPAAAEQRSSAPSSPGQARDSPGSGDGGDGGSCGSSPPASDMRSLRLDADS